MALPQPKTTQHAFGQGSMLTLSWTGRKWEPLKTLGLTQAGSSALPPINMHDTWADFARLKRILSSSRRSRRSLLNAGRQDAWGTGAGSGGGSNLGAIN